MSVAGTKPCVYLDWNATSPLRPAVRAAMLACLGPPANPASIHTYGRAAANAVDTARSQVAALCGWPAAGVVFTGGATEANATVVSRGPWLVSAVEHPSVAVWGAGTIPVDDRGIVDVDMLDRRLAEGAPDGALWAGVSVVWVNNETGVISPITAIAAVCRARGVPLHVDAAQAPGRLALDPQGIDLLTLSAHKLGGPTGVGALLVRPGYTVEALLRGGPQERGRRAGTQNVPGIVGFGVAAAEIAAEGPMAATLRDSLEAGLVALGGRVAGGGAPRSPNTSCVGFEDVDAADLVAALDMEGIAVSPGSACASGSPRPSPVLRAMGFPGSAVRFSLGPTTTAAEVERVVEAVGQVLGRVRG